MENNVKQTWKYSAVLTLLLACSNGFAVGPRYARAFYRGFDGCSRLLSGLSGISRTGSAATREIKREIIQSFVDQLNGTFSLSPVVHHNGHEVSTLAQDPTGRIAIFRATAHPHHAMPGTPSGERVFMYNGNTR